MPPIERDQLAWVFTMSLQKGGGGGGGGQEVYSPAIKARSAG
jgi:hypothetical protein